MDLLIARAEAVRITGWPDDRDLADLAARLRLVGDAAYPGFVGRGAVEGADPPFLRYGDRLVVDLSLWRSYADVWHFAYARTPNESARCARVPVTSAVLWWVAPGDVPTPEEAVHRLEHLERSGPGPAAFTLRSPAPPPGSPLPAVRRPVPTGEVVVRPESPQLCAR